MKILLTGATGFVGKQLCKALALQGLDLVVLTRNKSTTKYSVPAPHVAVEWKEILDSSKMSDASVFRNLDAVIHLAGESIVGKRWSPSFKKQIRNSRIGGTRSLVKLLQDLGNLRPKVFISASATGYFGDCGDQVLTESHSPGSDFLAQVCKEWEDALFNSSLFETRKVALRFGIVLGKEGGALEKMIPAFAAGVGAYLGNGKQWMSWVHIDDLISIILEALVNERVSGPINACAPDPVTNQEFTNALTKSLRTFKGFKIPRPILKAAVGEVADTLLSSQRVIPEKLKSLGFQFQYSTVDSALQAILNDSYALGYEELLSQCWIPKPIEQVFEFFSAAHKTSRYC